MSAKTWLKEFYPKSAKWTTKKEAIQHSVKKWEGLQKSHLKRHKIYHSYGKIFDEILGSLVIEIDAESCSLCFHYFKEGYEEDECSTCPLYQARDNVSCADARDDEGDLPPLDEMVDYDNPKPMLKWLRKALRVYGSTK